MKNILGSDPTYLFMGNVEFDAYKFEIRYDVFSKIFVAIDVSGIVILLSQWCLVANDEQMETYLHVRCVCPAGITSRAELKNVTRVVTNGVEILQSTPTKLT